MEKFNTATISRNGFVTGIWALPSGVNFTDAKKLEIKNLIAEKPQSLKAKFSVIFKVEYSAEYMGCSTLDSFIKGVVNSVNG